MRISKSLLVLFCAIFSITLTACAKKVQKEAVYIPAKCEIKEQAKPYPKDNQKTSERVIEILQYTERIENDLNFCRGNTQQ